MVDGAVLACLPAPPRSNWALSDRSNAVSFPGSVLFTLTRFYQYCTPQQLTTQEFFKTGQVLLSPFSTSLFDWFKHHVQEIGTGDASHRASPPQGGRPAAHLSLRNVCHSWEGLFSLRLHIPKVRRRHPFPPASTCVTREREGLFGPPALTHP